MMQFSAFLQQRLEALLSAIAYRLISLPRAAKRTLLVITDLACFYLAVWLAFSLRLGELYTFPDFWLNAVSAVAPVLGIVTFVWFSFYRTLTRYQNSQMFVSVVMAVSLSVLLWSLVIVMMGISHFPRSVIILYGVLSITLICVVRYSASTFLITFTSQKAADPDEKPAVAIFGAGKEAVRLLDDLEYSREVRVVGFLEDTPSLWGQYLRRHKIYRRSKLTRLIEREQVSEVVLALPSTEGRKRKEIVDWLQQHPVNVRVLPSLEDIATGRVTFSSLRNVSIEDMLGRDMIPPNPELLGATVKDKSVLVTGAGGSIGSELVRQIARQLPRKLVLLEHSEFALYEIENEMLAYCEKLPGEARPAIVSVLGSVLDDQLVNTVLSGHGIDTIYHTAAYKHVPIVEANPFVGVKNNTFGTRTLVHAASAANVERMVLISTDKAVRPSNVMGASKRLAELIVQTAATNSDCETIFTMVRFGNVLDSSGSVARKFRQQISAGGPLTVTHPDVVRYFMSIPEAAELVLQAGSMAEGGEVFVLDMGEPIRIQDFARTITQLMGKTIRDESNPDGEIELNYTGLRPGEKLYEELHLGENVSMTQHKRIFRSMEPSIAVAHLNHNLDQLETAITNYDYAMLRKHLLDLVEGFKPDSQNIDLITLSHNDDRPPSVR